MFTMRRSIRPGPGGSGRNRLSKPVCLARCGTVLAPVQPEFHGWSSRGVAVTLSMHKLSICCIICKDGLQYIEQLGNTNG